MNCSIIFNRQVETTIRPSARWLFIFHIILLVIISVLFCCCCCIVLLTVARSAFTNGWIRVCVHSVCVSTSCRKGRQTNSPLRALNFYLTKQKKQEEVKISTRNKGTQSENKIKIKSTYESRKCGWANTVNHAANANTTSNRLNTAKHMLLPFNTNT